MLFQETITIPAATLIDSPQQTRAKLVHGTITRVSVEYPFGCGELAGVRLLRGINQIWPITQGEFVSWNEGVVTTAENYLISDAPFEVIIETVNYDNLNAHTVTVRLEVDPTLVTPGQSLLQRLRELL